jgi:ABC-2 type transport system ATP-binding protein
VAGLEKVYAGARAVDGLSFAVEPGEVLALLGPNGAGKTTTLRSIAGILPFNAGSIRIDGFDIRSRAIDAKRRLAYVPDDPKLFDSLSTWEHFQFIARVYDVPDHAEKAEALLSRFDLQDKRNALAGELSRGMRQKLATACALLHGPRVLLLDEPMTGLDPRAIRTLYQLLDEHRAGGAAIVLSSHLLSMVERIATRVLVLHRGKALLHGRLEEIRARFPELSRDASLEEVFFRATEVPEASP